MSQIQEFGFVLLKKVVPLDRIAALYQSCVSLLSKYDLTLSAADCEALRKEPPFSGARFNKTMLELRRSRPELFGILYDTVQLSGTIQQVADAPSLLSAVSEAWGVPVDGIALTGHMLRMDPPLDKRNALDWHQDSSYYFQNLAGNNGLVLWIPMHRVNAGNGAVIVCPASHREGKITVSMTGKSDANTSEQYRVPDTALAKYSQHQVEAEAGDALIFNMDLFHRSGVNSSDGIRFITGVRAHNMLVDDFLPGKLFYEPNKKIGRFGDYKKQHNLGQPS